MIILDTIKYFAKFPDRQSVLKAFTSGKSSISGYAALKDYVTQMSEHSLLPSIKGFIIGSDIEDVKNRIEAQTDIFLFFDYGEISSNINQKNTIENSWTCSVTIANKMNEESDTLEFGLNSDNMLTIAKDVLAQMYSDQQQTPWLKNLGQNYRIVPFDVKQLSAYGWSILFEKEGADMLNIKNL